MVGSVNKEHAFMAGMTPRVVALQMDVNYSTVTAIKEGRSYVGIGQ